jgi:hypothetical protein
MTVPNNRRSENCAKPRSKISKRIARCYQVPRAIGQDPCNCSQPRSDSISNSMPTGLPDADVCRATRTRNHPTRTDSTQSSRQSVPKGSRAVGGPARRSDAATTASPWTLDFGGGSTKISQASNGTCTECSTEVVATEVVPAGRFRSSEIQRRAPKFPQASP